MNTIAYATAELLESHAELTRAGIPTHAGSQPLSISQRCALVREALVAWGSTQSILKDIMR